MRSLRICHTHKKIIFVLKFTFLSTLIVNLIQTLTKKISTTLFEINFYFWRWYHCPPLLPFADFPLGKREKEKEEKEHTNPIKYSPLLVLVRVDSIKLSRLLKNYEHTNKLRHYSTFHH